MKDPLGVSPSKGNQGTTRGKEKILLTSVGIEPTTWFSNVQKLGRQNANVLRSRSERCLVSHVIVEFPNSRHMYALRTYFSSCKIPEFLKTGLAKIRTHSTT